MKRFTTKSRFIQKFLEENSPVKKIELKVFAGNGEYVHELTFDKIINGKDIKISLEVDYYEDRKV